MGRGATRRGLLAGLAGLAAGGPATTPGSRAWASAGRDRVGARLDPWRPGTLDIHHLSTGRGDATLVVGPDGTTLLIDAGAASRIDASTLPARPDASRRAGEWIGRYVLRRLEETGHSSLDTALITHLHPDHTGGVAEHSPLEPGGRYHLTGLSDVARQVPIERIIDPDFPDYGYPRFEDAVSAGNYVAFVRARLADGHRVERFAVGRADQITLVHARSAVPFEVRNLAARGRVWTGQGDAVRSVFPNRADLANSDQPDENAGSLAIRLSFGSFRYFAAGDLTAWARAGARPWMDALTPAAEACGRVSVAVVPHHGLFDGPQGPAIGALAARAWIISAWHASHPSPSTLERLLEERLYPGARDIYATDLSPAMDLIAGRLTRRLASRAGHVIVRVDQDGQAFQVVTTAATDEEDLVVSLSSSVNS
ncbi:ComEC/Rec2 family competence protein [Brevundimonas bacteroides]|uniref:ComEC/Rec2 family competence protein n=1 Tax=Brevundimonas bacteroides TaxID=74311 RepID=UPI000494E3E8|nr:MBL fold metallo-hydrolase [Brevundimonas bacteroides]